MRKIPFLSLLAGLFLVLWFAAALRSIRTGQAQAERELLENALHRGAVACYAAEGVYPPTVDYLCEQYGIQIDESRYAVFYEVFADNLMPNITVVERK